jgi:hypothetical protein
VARTGVKRFLLILLIVSLVAAALVGAAIFVVGSAGDLEARILVTVLLLGFFSLTGLCAAVRLERGLAWLGWIGILASLGGLAYSELVVWEVVPVEGFDELKPALSLGVAAAALGYISLLLLARGPYRSVNLVVWLTAALVAAIAAALIAVIITEVEPPDEAVRALGAVAVLTVLGSLLAPLLRKFLMLGEAAPSSGPARSGRGRHRPRAPDRRTEEKGV